MLRVMLPVGNGLTATVATFVSGNDSKVIVCRNRLCIDADDDDFTNELVRYSRVASS